jgi:FAD/FMN-containing dehydrogenase
VRRRAWVQGGALLGALDRAAQQYGLATTAGNVSHTGVGGLTLGGGMGWLARQYRLTCDNVTSFQLVTATGEVVRASRHSHPDLYWALRGGGGNFGVVTEFEFRLHPVGTQALLAELSFPVVPAQRALDALRGWRDLLLAAPREATFTASIGSDGMVVVGFVWVGDPAPGRRLLPALRALGQPSAERVLELSYLELQRMSDSVQKHALRRYSKGHYLRELPDEALEAFLGRGAPSGDGGGDFLPNAGFQAYGGAIADVPDRDTPFSHRDALVEFGAGTSWADPAQDDARIAAARRCAAVLDEYASGAYVNFVNDEGAEGVLRAYSPEKLTRLTAVKTAYDPDNVFHLNHNISPASR